MFHSVCCCLNLESEAFITFHIYYVFVRQFLKRWLGVGWSKSKVICYQILSMLPPPCLLNLCALVSIPTSTILVQATSIAHWEACSGLLSGLPAFSFGPHLSLHTRWSLEGHVWSILLLYSPHTSLLLLLPSPFS